jgi:hypothetical protein
LLHHVLDAIFERRIETDVNSAGHLVGQEKSAAADEDDPARLRQRANGPRDLAEDGHLGRVGGIVGEVERFEEVGQPGMGRFFQRFDEPLREMEVDGDFFNQLPIPAGPGLLRAALAIGLGAVEIIGQLLGQGPCPRADLTADGDKGDDRSGSVLPEFRGNGNGLNGGQDRTNVLREIDGA